MKKKLKRLASVLSAVMTLTFLTPTNTLQMVRADQTKESDGLPIVEGNYEDSNFYWDNLLGVAGNFQLFAFDSIYNDTHVNGNLACKNWYIGGNYTEPHTSFGNYESHPLVNVISEKINTTAESVDFGAHTVKHPDYDDGKIWGVGMINTIFVPESYDVKHIDTSGEQTNINNNAPIGERTFIISDNPSDLENGVLQIRPTNNTSGNVMFGHTTDSYIDFDSLKSQYVTLSNQLSKLPNNVTPYYDQYDYNKNSVWLNNYGTNVINVSAADFKPIMRINGINYTEANGYQGNQSLVVNVDLSGVDYFEIPHSVKFFCVDGEEIKDEEQMAFKGTNIIYNFYNAKPNTTVVTHALIGHILAPNCTLVADGGSGSFIAQNIYASNETHMSFIPSGLTIDLPELCKVAISKTNIDGSKELVGAKLTLTGYDNFNNEIIINNSSVKLGEGARINDEYEGNGVSFFSGSTKTIISDLPDGTYTLKEDGAPAGYAVTTDITFTVKDGKVVDDYNYVTSAQGNDPAVVTMKDDLLKRNVTISKSNIAGNEIQGATLVLSGKDSDNKVITFSNEQIDLGNNASLINTGNEVRFVSGSDKTSIKDLQAGTYTLTEITAPDGYLKAETITFEITSDMRIKVGDNYVDEIKMIDDYATDLYISKQDIDSSEELVGARLTLTGTDTNGNKIVFDKSQVTVGESGVVVSADENGITYLSGKTPTFIEDLPDGKYTLTEDGAPAGYDVTTAITFTIEDGVVKGDSEVVVEANGNNPAIVTMKDALLTKDIEFSKTTVAGAELPGATLVLTGVDANNNVISFTEEQVVLGDDAALGNTGKEIRFVSGSSKTLIKDLRAGKYTLTEITAPKGYNKAESVVFELTSDMKILVDGKEVSEITMVDGDMADCLISKVDADEGGELPGAELILEGKDNNGKDIIIDKADVVLGDGASFDDSYEGSGIKYVSGTTPTFIKDLPDGTYTLTENAAPAGYDVTTSITFKVEDGKVTGDSEFVTEAQGDNPAIVTMKDAMFTSDVLISKQDIDSSEELVGAKLTLKGTGVNGMPVTFKADQIVKGDGAIIFSDSGNEITFLSGSTPTLIKNLPDGKYILSEDAAPAGYDVTTDITFIIENGVVTGDAEYVVSANGTGSATVTMKDALLTKDVVFSKADAAGAELPGATLVLTGKDVKNNKIIFTDEQVVLGNDASLVNTGDEVRFVSGSTTTLIKNLQAGKYTLTEITAPKGYAQAETITFELTSDMKVLVDGKEVDGIKMVDDYATDVVISKTAVDGSDELPGATLTLTGKDKNNNEIVIDKNTVDLGNGASFNNEYQGNGVSFVSGTTSTFIKDLPDGTYTLHENAAPAGYDVSTDITFTIENGEVKGDAEVVVKANGDNPAVVTMKDALLTKDVVFSKADAAGDELPGATLVLTGNDIKNNKITFTDEQVILGNDASLVNTGDEVRFVSGSTTTLIKNLPAGKYTLTEITAPKGYAQAETITFELTSDMKVLVDGKEVDGIKMVDDYATDVVISKTAVDGSDELPGATLTLTGKDKNNNEIVIDKNTVDLGNGASFNNEYQGNGVSFVSGTTSTFIKDLPDGTYTLHENAAPAGYDVSTDITFTIENGEVKGDAEVVVKANGDNPAVVTMKDALLTTDVVISKTAVDGSDELPGATLTLTGKDNNDNEIVIDKDAVVLGDGASFNNEYQGNGVSYVSGTTSTLIKNLPDGTYTLHENAAPAGYDVTTDITFTIENGEVKGTPETVVAANGNNPAVVTMKDAMFKTDVAISKTAIDGSEELVNARLTLSGKDYNDQPVIFNAEQIVKGDNAVVIKDSGDKITFLSGTTTTLIKNLPDGKYTLREEAAPAGYDVSTDITFTIENGEVKGTPETVVAADGNNPAVVTMKDAMFKTDVVISKTAVDGSDELPGATLTLEGKTVAKEDVVIDKNTVDLGDGAKFNDEYQGNGVSFVSGTTSTLIKNLPDGTYTLHENAAPAGYDVTTDITFTIENGEVKGDAEVVVKANGSNPAVVTMKDAMFKTDVAISKTAVDGSDELPGATLTLTGKDKNDNEIVIDKNTVDLGNGASFNDEYQGNGVSFVSGTTSTLIKNLPDGTYTLHEEAAPKGYVVATDITFTIENGEVKGDAEVVVKANGSNPAVVTMKDDVEITPTPVVTDTPTTTPVVTGTPTDTPTTTPVVTGTPTETPTTTPVVTGTPTETPTTTPVVTGTPTETPTITPVVTGTPTETPTTTPVVTVTPTQAPKTDVVISKTAIDGSDELVGARIILTGVDNDGKTVVFTESQIVKGTSAVILETGEEFKYLSGSTATLVKDLPDGTYTLHEDAAPAGYDVTTDITFTIENGEVKGTPETVVAANGNNPAVVTMKDAMFKTDVVISKTAVDGSDELPGATLTLEGKTIGNEVVKIDKDTVDLGNGASFNDEYQGNGVSFVSGTTSTLIKNLPDGTYTLHEEAAPKGYAVATDIAFTIENGEVKGDAEVVVKANGSNPAVVTMKDDVEVTPTPVVTDTPTTTPVVTGTPTDTPTTTPVVTGTPTETPTTTPVVTGTPTETPTTTPVVTGTPTDTPTTTPVVTGTPTDTPTTTPVVTGTPTETPTTTPVVTGTPTDTPTTTPVVTGTPTDTPTTTPVVTGTPTDTPTTTPVVTGTPTTTPVVTVTPTQAPKTDVVISKTAVDGSDELVGARIILTGVDKDGKTVVFTESQIVKGTSATILETGEEFKYLSGSTATLVKDLSDGTYTLHEDAAPAGYDVTTDITFTIENGEVKGTPETVVAANGNSPAVVTMKDAMFKTDVVISKTAVDGSDELPGATLTLEGKTIGNEVIKIDKNTVDLGDEASFNDKYQGDGVSFVSGKTSTLIKDLPDGTYTLHEEAAPKGYAVATDITFTIENGEVKGDAEVVVKANGSNPAIVTMKDDVLVVTTPTPVVTGTPTETPTTTPVVTGTPTETPTTTPVVTGTPTETPTTTPVVTGTPTDTPTTTPVVTGTPTDTPTTTPVVTGTPTDTPTTTPVVTGTPTDTPTTTPVVTGTPTDTPTTTPVVTGTPTETPTTTPVVTGTPTDTPTTTPVVTGTPTDTPTTTPVVTGTPTDTPTTTPVVTATPTDEPTTTPVVTGTPTEVPTTTPTETPTNEPTPVVSVTPVPTPDVTPSTTPVPTTVIERESTEATPTNSPVVKVTNVTVDGSNVDDGSYTVGDDGKVTLTPDSTNGLSDGTHKIVVTYEDGSTDTIEISVSKTSDTTKVSSSKAVVSTGETSEYLTIACICGFVAIMIFLFRRRFTSFNK